MLKNNGLSQPVNDTDEECQGERKVNYYPENPEESVSAYYSCQEQKHIA